MCVCVCVCVCECVCVSVPVMVSELREVWVEEDRGGREKEDGGVFNSSLSSLTIISVLE